MKINGPGNTNFIADNYRARQIDAYKKSAGVPARDEAALSSEAISFSKVFTEAREALNLRGASDPSRIADIKERVQAGTYRVNSEDIADSILKDLFG